MDKKKVFPKTIRYVGDNLDGVLEWLDGTLIRMIHGAPLIEYRNRGVISRILIENGQYVVQEETGQWKAMSRAEYLAYEGTHEK